MATSEIKRQLLRVRTNARGTWHLYKYSDYDYRVYDVINDQWSGFGTEDQANDWLSLVAAKKVKSS